MDCQRSGNCCYTMDVIIMADRPNGLRAVMKPGGKLCPHLSHDDDGKASCAVHDRPEYKFSPCWIYGNPDVDPDFGSMRGRPCGVGQMIRDRGGMPSLMPERSETIEIDTLEDIGPWSPVREQAKAYEWMQDDGQSTT